MRMLYLFPKPPEKVGCNIPLLTTMGQFSLALSQQKHKTAFIYFRHKFIQVKMYIFFTFFMRPTVFLWPPANFPDDV